MFDAITIKSKESGNIKIDIGFLAECLLFYKNLNFLADKETLPDLFLLCGIDEVRELIQQGRLNLFIREDIIGTSMFQTDKGEMYDLQTWISDSFTQEKLLNECFLKLTESNEKASKLTDEFLELTKPFKYNKGILEEIKSDLNDSIYLANAISSIIRFWNPNQLVDPTTIETKYYEAGEFGPFKTHAFESNLDFTKYEKVTPSGIILDIAETRGDIHIASHFGSEIADKSIYSTLIKHRVNSLFEKVESNKHQIDSFQEVVLQDYKPVGEVLINKQKDFKDFMEILHSSDKFRDWLNKVEEDKNLIAEYYNAVTKETWVDKLPTKGVRFAVFTAAGIALDSFITGGIGTIAGVTLGAGDTFVLDKIIKGWKPNQFIDDNLKPFLSKNDDEE